MTHLVRRLILGDLRAAPGRAAAVAVLLGAAALLPTLIASAPAVGAVLAFATTVAATSGATAAHDRRAAVLRLNGGTPLAIGGWIDAATMVVPGAVGAAGAAVVGAMLSPGPRLVSIVWLALVVPIAAAPLAGWLASRSVLDPARAASPDASAPRRRGPSLGRALLALVVALINPVLLLAWLALRLASPARSPRPLGRLAGVVLALVIVVGTAIAAGSASDWTTLGFVLYLAGPAAALSVAVLGSAALDGTGALTARAGPWSRIALSPLTGRSRSLGPIVGVLAVVTSLAAMNATVGASFGQREHDRERTLPTRTEQAGSGPDQAIGNVHAVEPAALRRIADDVSAATATRAVVIERHGIGTMATYDGPQFPDIVEPPTTFLGADEHAAAPIWLGIVEPSDLEALGLGASAPDLAAGKVVLLNPELAADRGRVTVSHSGTRTDLPAVPATGPTGGIRLPGGLVSRATAEALEGPISTAQVVVVPGPGGRAEPAALRSAAQAIVDGARRLPLLTPDGLDATAEASFSTSDLFRANDPVLLGDEHVVVFRSGPLNDVPVLAGTREAGSGQLVGLGALGLLMAVAGVGLALGATRSDDLVLRAQGAPRALRSAIGAIQAAVLTGSSSVLAAVMGVGLPALAFQVYNGGSTLPDIPLVVPAEVPALLVGLPVAAAALTALFNLRGRRSGDAEPVAMDGGLAW
ncbi:MAG: hypothetical protein ACRD0R_17325 [Acidimicrobiales bacterium]